MGRTKRRRRDASLVPSDKGPSLWFAIVLAFCGWSLFLMTRDLGRGNLVVVLQQQYQPNDLNPNAPSFFDTADEIDKHFYSRLSAEKCPNVILQPLFRPRGYYGLPLTLRAAGNSTTVQAASAARNVAVGASTPSGRSNASEEGGNVVWELLRAEIEGAGPQKNSKRRRKVLVVVPGLGEAQRMNLTLRSLETLRQSTEDDGDGNSFACLVYVYEVDLLEEAKDRMQHLCEVVLNVGMWTAHMKSVPPLTNPETDSAAELPWLLSPSLRQLTNDVTHVAIMMDDMDVADLDLARFVALMDFTGFGVASPAFPNDYYEVMRRRCECVYHRTDFVNVMFAVFTRRVWQCWQSLIDPVANSFGWGMDIALAGLCNTTSGVLDVFDTYHRGSSRIYSTEEASKQMVSWIVKHTNIQRENEKRYRDCVTIHRPKAVFPRCELYWDGTQHSDEAHALAADWDCALEFQK
jgi:Protein of unknown function (DUF707)